MIADRIVAEYSKRVFKILFKILCAIFTLNVSLLKYKAKAQSPEQYKIFIKLMRKHLEVLQNAMSKLVNPQLFKPLSLSNNEYSYWMKRFNTDDTLKNDFEGIVFRQLELGNNFTQLRVYQDRLNKISEDYIVDSMRDMSYHTKLTILLSFNLGLAIEDINWLESFHFVYANVHKPISNLIEHDWRERDETEALLTTGQTCDEDDISKIHEVLNKPVYEEEFFNHPVMKEMNHFEFSVLGIMTLIRSFESELE